MLNRIHFIFIIKDFPLCNWYFLFKIISKLIIILMATTMKWNKMKRTYQRSGRNRRKNNSPQIQIHIESFDEWEKWNGVWKLGSYLILLVFACHVDQSTIVHNKHTHMHMWQSSVLVLFSTRNELRKLKRHKVLAANTLAIERCVTMFQTRQIQNVLFIFELWMMRSSPWAIQSILDRC